MGNRWWQNGHAAMFEVKFGQKTERATTESRERSAEQLFDTLEPVALAVEGSDLGASEDCFEPTASCINDTKKRQLVTRSGPDWDAVYAISTTSGRWIHLLLFENSSEQCFNRCVTSRLVSGDANAAAYKYYKKQEYQDLHNSSVAIMLREMRREVNMGLPFENKLHIDYSTNNHPTQLHAADDLDCCFMAILSWRKPAGARFTRKFSSDLKQNHAVTSREQLPELRERTNYPRWKRTEEISRERRIKAQLRATAQRAHRDREDATDPMVAPQDYDVHQSVRVLELQNSDPWLRPTHRSWHFPILMTIREEPFKNNRSRTSENGRPSSRRPRSRRSRKTMMDEVMPTGKIILVMAPTYDLDIFILATLVLEKNAQAFWLENIIRLEQPRLNAGTKSSSSWQSSFSWPWRMSTSPMKTFPRIHDDENNVCL